jgi:tetratricopeptide (TPR) repeat protein
MKKSASALALTCLLVNGAAPGTDSSTLSAPRIEEATTVARHTVDALTRRNEAVLEKTFDEPSLVAAAMGPLLATRLTPRQKRAVSARIIQWIAAPFSAPAVPPKIPLFLGTRTEGTDALVSFLVPVASGYLKTDWRMRSIGAEWLIEDVVLSDLGRSLSEEAIASLGTPPIARTRSRGREARRVATPRIIGLVAVIVAGAIFARRAQSKERMVLLVAFAAPAFLFLADGYLAVSRVWNEPVELRLSDGSPWQYPLQQFQLAVTRRNRARARSAAAEAISRGARPEPLHLVLGRMAEDSNDPGEAIAAYTRAIAPPHPAPGGWAGLARLDVAAGRDAAALEKWRRYFDIVPADPNSLFWQAVAFGHLHDLPAAQTSVARAIDLDPLEPELHALSAKFYGAAGDAPNAIARLRELEKLAPIDRQILAADRNFAPIADDEKWRQFLAEAAKPRANQDLPERSAVSVRPVFALVFGGDPL